MPGKHYSSQELETLQRELQLGAPLSELEVKLGRTAYGIAAKLYKLSRQEPNNWNSQRAREFLAAHQRGSYQKYRNRLVEYHRRYRQEHEGKIRKIHKKHDKNRKGKWLRFGNYLSQLISNYKGNREQVALQLEIKEGSLNKIIRGDRRPGKELLARMSSIFQVPYETMLPHLK